MTDKPTSDRRVREFFVSGLKEERNHVRAGQPVVQAEDPGSFDAELIGIAAKHVYFAVQRMREGKVDDSMDHLRRAVDCHHAFYSDDTAAGVAVLIAHADDRCVTLYNQLKSVPPPK